MGHFTNQTHSVKLKMIASAYLSKYFLKWSIIFWINHESWWVNYVHAINHFQWMIINIISVRTMDFSHQLDEIDIIHAKSRKVLQKTKVCLLCKDCSKSWKTVLKSQKILLEKPSLNLVTLLKIFGSDVVISFQVQG